MFDIESLLVFRENLFDMQSVSDQV